MQPEQATSPSQFKVREKHISEHTQTPNLDSKQGPFYNEVNLLPNKPLCGPDYIDHFKQNKNNHFFVSAFPLLVTFCLYDPVR